MHIDHSKLVELLTEASGIDKEKIKKQLAELVEEIQGAISEGDAYEVDGLGVFSGIGNNIMFIPADEFATEINYKYVGMEPIEMEGSTSEPEAQEGTTQPEESEESETIIEEDDEDPFAGLLDDDDEEESTGSSFVMDLLNESDEDYPEGKTDEVPASEDEAQDLEELADEEAEESVLDSANEEVDEDTEEEVPDESKPGPDKWGIDTYKDDADTGMFSGLLGDKKEEAAEDQSDAPEDDLSNIFDEAEEESDEDLAAELSKQFSEDDDEEENVNDIFASEENKEETVKGVEKDEDDFDDPFDELADDEGEDGNEEEVVPVITNLASESSKKKKEKAAKEKSSSKETAKEEDSPQKPREAKKQPVLLWVLLIIVIFAGGAYGLGYFGILNIPGVTPESQMTASQAQPPAPQPEQPQTPASQATENEQATPETEDATPQQPAENNVQNQEETVQEQPEQTQVSQSSNVPAGQPTYGLRGVTDPSANSGYTIVVYSLSDEGNARNKLTELRGDGYRALLASIPSQQYGQLWRVSLGQFESQRTAAIAAENLRSPFSENYFITKIK
jgi:hypothetical protein